MSRAVKEAPLVQSHGVATLPEISGDKLVEMQKRIASMKPEDDRMVKGVFRNLETPGGFHSFTFRSHKGTLPKSYKMEDGETYEIPLSVAMHLNSACAYPVNAHLQDARGNPIIGVGKYKQRFQFSSLDF